MAESCSVDGSVAGRAMAGPVSVSALTTVFSATTNSNEGSEAAGLACFGTMVRRVCSAGLLGFDWLQLFISVWLNRLGHS
jgi:hypothetical protein